MTWVDEHGPDELYAKFTVTRNRTGETIGEPEFVFVLRPESDYHAWVALGAYAESVKVRSPGLAAQITERLRLIDLASG